MKYNKILTLFTLFAVLPILSLQAEVKTPRFISDGKNWQFHFPKTGNILKSSGDQTKKDIGVEL